MKPQVSTQSELNEKPRAGPSLTASSYLMSAHMEVTVGGVRWWVTPECREILLRPDGLRLREWLNNGQARVVKQGPHRIVYRVQLPTLNFYLKHNLLPDARAWF